MVVDGKQVKKYPIYTFETFGEHKVSFILKELDPYSYNDTYYFDYYFENCSFLKQCTIRDNFNREAIYCMDSMFNNCVNLESFVFEGESNMESLVRCDSMFKNCIALTHFDYFDTSNVYNMRNMFDGSNIEEFDFRNISLSSIEYLDNMFDGSKLNKVFLSDELSTLPNSVTTNGIFDNLSESGLCQYECNYDFTNFIQLIPSTWDVECVPLNITHRIIMVKDSNEITTLSDGETLTITENKVNGIYSEEQKCWLFNYDATQVNDNVYYNDEVLTQISNNNFKKKYFFIGDCSNYSGYSFETTFVATTSSDYTIFNDAQLNNMLGVTLDGYQIQGNVAHLDEPIVDSVHTVRYVFDTEDNNSMEGLFQVATYDTQQCYNIKTIKFNENFNTSNIINMDSLFGNCHSIETIDISSFDTSNVTTMQHMFGRCYKLTEIKGINSINTNKVTNMKWLFAVCSSMTEFNISNLDTSNVTDMFGMFYQCKNVTEIFGLENFNTSKVTTMEAMFQSCEKITNISSIYNWDVSKVYNMNDMFIYCYELTSFDFSHWNTESLFYTQGMFMHCSKVIVEFGETFNMPIYVDSMFNIIGNVKIDLSGWYYDENKGSYYNGVYNMYRLFRDCKNLEEIVFGEGFKNCYNFSINGMFYGCSNLKRIIGIENIGSFCTSTSSNSKATFQNVFNGCSSLESIDLSKWSETFNNNCVKSCTSMFANCHNLTSINLSGWDIFKIGDVNSMFNGCRALESTNDIIGFNSLNTTESTNMSYMFANCSALTYVDLSGINGKNNTNSSYMFYQCKNLNNINNIENFNINKVTTMHSMFFKCSGLTSLDLSKWETNNLNNMECMFSGCTSLSNLLFTKDKFNTSKVTTLRCTFGECGALTNLDVSMFNTSNVTTMHGTFSRCSGLTSLDVSNFNTSKVTNMEYTFDYCSSLESIDLSNWNISNVTTTKQMFDSSTSLCVLKMNSELTKLTTLTDMFKNITTNGILYYNCNYDYTKIKNILPTTWSSECLS